MNDHEEPKKRGRKKKEIDLNAPPKVKGKRGRKPLGKIVEMNIKSVDYENESIIMNLPINIYELNKEHDSPKFDNDASEDISTIFDKPIVSAQNYTNDTIEESQVMLNECTYLNKRKVINTTLNLVNIEGKWSNETKIDCWWDSCSFSSRPVSIPFKYFNKSYHVYGVYCSFNCALAAILKEDDTKVWEKISLLNKMYCEMYGTNDPIYPAYDKRTLIKYGGNLSIEEYRNKFVILNKEYLYYIPPMKSIVPQIEETTRVIANSDNKLTIRLSDTKIQSARSEKSKVINKYSLDNTLGLKIKSKLV
jgi:hypothetical protein